MLPDIVDDGLVRSRLTGMRPESSLLLALSRLHLSDEECARVHSYLAEHGDALDWGVFLDQAARHGVLPLVGRNLIALRLVHTDTGRTLAPYRWIHTFVYEGNRRRNLAMRDEYAKVLRGLNRIGVDYAVRKGPVLTEGVYHDLGLRRMGDLDVLLRRDDLPAFTDMATELGYQQGHLSRNAESVVPFDRRTQLVWQVNLTNSTLPFLKPARRDDVETFVLDPCFAVFQPRSGITVDVGDMFARAIDTVHFGEPSRMLDTLDQIVDMCVQLHVEATTLMYIELGKDLTVLKFLDLVELLRTLKPSDVDALAERVDGYGCRESVGYAIHHAACVYPEDVAPDVLAAFEVADPTVLDVYGVLDEQPQKWDREFGERLFDSRRKDSLTVHSTVPGPRAVV